MMLENLKTNTEKQNKWSHKIKTNTKIQQNQTQLANITKEQENMDDISTKAVQNSDDFPFKHTLVMDHINWAEITASIDWSWVI